MIFSGVISSDLLPASPFQAHTSASSKEVKAELNMYVIFVPSLLLHCCYKKTHRLTEILNNTQRFGLTCI